MPRTIPAVQISKLGRFLELEDIGVVYLGFIHDFTKHRKYNTMKLNTDELLR